MPDLSSSLVQISLISILSCKNLRSQLDYLITISSNPAGNLVAMGQCQFHTLDISWFCILSTFRSTQSVHYYRIHRDTRSTKSEKQGVHYRLNMISQRVTLNLKLRHGPNMEMRYKLEVRVSLREYGKCMYFYHGNQRFIIQCVIKLPNFESNDGRLEAS